MQPEPEKKTLIEWKSEEAQAIVQELTKMNTQIALPCPPVHLEKRICICIDCKSLGVCKLEKSLRSKGCVEKFLTGCMHRYNMENKDDEKEGESILTGPRSRSDSEGSIKGN
jgi:hypothetical protein